MPNSPTPDASAQQRRRIVLAAGQAFAARGYHGASIEEVCSEAGLNSRTVASHFATKYELFRQVTLAAVDTLLAASDLPTPPPTDSREARATLAELMEAIAQTSIAERESSGFYRSEARYLEPEHREELADRLRRLRRRIERPLRQMRPELTEGQIAVLAVAALSAITSTTLHSTSMPEPKIVMLLTIAARRILDSTPDITPGPRAPIPVDPVPWRKHDSPRSRIIAAAVDLFHSHGFHAVTFDDIVEESGLTKHQVVAHFGDSTVILLEAFRTGLPQIPKSFQEATQASLAPRELLTAFGTRYVGFTFREPRLMSVFLNDGRTLPDDNREEMRALHRTIVGPWVRTLQECRQELSMPEARLLIYAALNIVADIGHVMRWQNTERVTAVTEQLVLSTMIVSRSAPSS